ncbi:MAG: transposase [Selenomonadaceae bacterium]|nr:transposase [Selenomonadaceae bacterium]
MKYTTTNREGYKEYKSDPKVCKDGPYRDKCTMSQNMTKVVTRHIWAEYMEQAEEYRYVPKYKEIYKERKETIERVFAEGKERHGLRYATMRGLAKLKMQATLIFACMNLKKIALWKKKGRESVRKSYILFLILYNFALTKIKRVFLIFRGKHVLSTV